MGEFCAFVIPFADFKEVKTGVCPVLFIDYNSMLYIGHFRDCSHNIARGRGHQLSLCAWAWKPVFPEGREGFMILIYFFVLVLWYPKSLILRVHCFASPFQLLVNELLGSLGLEG